MDGTLVAFGLSACLTMIFVLVLTAIVRGGKRPPNSDDRPAGPVTFGS